MISPTVAQMGILITIYLQDTPRLFVDKTADPLDSASSCQSPDSWLGNALNKFKLINVQSRQEHFRLPEYCPSGPCGAS